MSSALDETRNLRDASRLVVAAMQARYAEETSVKGLKIRHNNVLGYFVEVTAQHGDRLMTAPLNATFIHRQTLAGQVRFTTAELGEIEARIANAGDRALGLELEIFERLCAMVADASEDLRAAAHGFALLDVATALAKLAIDENYGAPRSRQPRSALPSKAAGIRWSSRRSSATASPSSPMPATCRRDRDRRRGRSG